MTEDSIDVSHIENEFKNKKNSVPVKKQKKELKKTLWPKVWTILGAGTSITSYSQETKGSTELSHTSVRTPHIMGEAGFMLTKKIGLTGSVSVSPGRLIEEGSLFDTQYTWTSYSLEGLYLFGGEWDKAFESSWYVRFGGSYQSIPILTILPTTRTLELIENNQISLGAGLGKKTSHSKKISSNIYINAQVPLSAKTSSYDYELDSGLIVTSSLGLSYQLSRNFNIGLYWQGKLLFSNYHLSDDFDKLNGSQLLLNNDLGFYLGFEY